MLTLSVQDLSRMNFEFVEAYDKLVEEASQSLQKALYLKLKAMKHCHDECKKLVNKQMPELWQVELRKKNFNFRYYDLLELQLLNLEDLEYSFSDSTPVSDIDPSVSNSEISSASITSLET